MALVIVALSAITAAPARAAASTFVLTSSAFTDGGAIPVQYSCVGAGTSPPLAWSNPPTGTKELALVVEDPDAPSGTFTHWVVANIPPAPPSIAADDPLAHAVVADNSLGRPAYQPMCPPDGPAHHYVFTLAALKKKVKLAPDADAAALRRAMKGKVLGRTTLTGMFARP